tara:strand:- start:6749 stop:7327 length:579 start_codon:yes stop_codon:yes gene_type:complete
MFNFFKTINFFYNISWYLKKNKLKNIKLIAMDIDGVLTNGSILLNQSGENMRTFNVHDGLGIKLLLEQHYKIAFISGGVSGSSYQRALDLGVKECFFEVKNKKETLKNIQNKFDLNKENTIFIGDDINDLVVKDIVSLFISPSSSTEIVLRKADLILKKEGGKGAIRELADNILRDKKIWKKIKKNGWVQKN